MKPSPAAPKSTPGPTATPARSSQSKARARESRAKALGIRENVEGAARRRRHAEAQREQALEQALAPLLERVAHARGAGRAARQRGDAAALREAARRDEQVLRQVLQSAQRGLRRHQPAEPETGHGVALGETVERERVVADRERGARGGSAVQQTVVDLVGNQRRAQRRQRLERGARLHRARRVRRRGHQDGARARRERGAHAFRIEPVAVGRIGRHQHGHAALRADDVRIAGVVRGAEHDLVAGIEQPREHQQQRRRGAAGHDHALGIERAPGAPADVERDRLAQLAQSAAVGVVRVAGRERRARRLDHGRRGREVGLADLEVHDAPARALELERALQHLHGEEGLDARSSATLQGIHLWWVAKCAIWCAERTGGSASEHGAGQGSRGPFRRSGQGVRVHGQRDPGVGVPELLGNLGRLDLSHALERLQRGETLAAVAKRFGVARSTLRERWPGGGKRPGNRAEIRRESGLSIARARGGGNRTFLAAPTAQLSRAQPRERMRSSPSRAWGAHPHARLARRLTAPGSDPSTRAVRDPAMTASDRG